MLSRYDFKQRGLISCVFVAVIFTLAACGGSGPVHRSWTEDVQLEDGSTIVVKRKVAFQESNSWSGDAYNAVETESAIAFTGNLSQLPPWSQPLMALVLYRDKETHEWVVVATTTSEEVAWRRGHPCPTYWEYRLMAQIWKEVPLSLASTGRSANLLTSYQSELKTKHITVKTRQELDKPSRPLEAMNPIEKSFRVILNKDEAKCPS